jgi:MoxR-like ATPase
MGAVSAVATTEQLVELQAESQKVYVDPALMQYAVRLVAATRDPEKHGIPDIAKYIMYGASPRASIYLIICARSLAFLRDRSYVMPQDVVDMVPDVMRHRLVLSYEALSDEVTGDAILHRILEHLPAPAAPLESHVSVGQQS